MYIHIHIYIYIYISHSEHNYCEVPYGEMYCYAGSAISTWRMQVVQSHTCVYTRVGVFLASLSWGSRLRCFQWVWVWVGEKSRFPTFEKQDSNKSPRPSSYDAGSPLPPKLCLSEGHPFTTSWLRLGLAR